MFLAFMLIPLLLCLAGSLAWTHSVRKNGPVEKPSRAPLPLINEQERLAFLHTYYEGNNREQIKTYLQVNSDVTVVEDLSAGSNASTVVAMKEDGSLYFRKYAYDADGEKLQEQVDWILAHQEDIPLPSICENRRVKNCVIYDMPNSHGTVGFFRYMHMMPLEDSYNILESALNDIIHGLHAKNVRQSDDASISEYIETKVLKNLKTIRGENKFISRLEKKPTIYVNGKQLHTLSFYEHMLEPDHLRQVFARDTYSDIHGDLTIENLICLTAAENEASADYEDKHRSKGYYFIDPNSGNVHDSPMLDYAKLLQSLHGGYEFLMMVKSVKIEHDRVDFMMIKSDVYVQLYERFHSYLLANFNRQQVLSIYYHEIVHWLRLMPYKIRKNERLAVVFYTGLLQVLNDVYELENADD